jgi:Na+-translocating ferredoxin:NAD+ oxidoreductase subunit G
MAKKESTFINMFLTLLIVTAISSLAASSVYNLTKGPIAEVARLKQQNAIEQVMPGPIDTEPQYFSVMPKSGTDSLGFWEGYANGEKIGVAINTYTNMGYSGLIRIMVGFDNEGTIVNYKVLEHKETAGLGTKIAAPFFVNQFIGRNPATQPLKVNKDGGDIDAITAATISSRAVCDAIQRAYDTYIETKESN